MLFRSTISKELTNEQNIKDNAKGIIDGRIVFKRFSQEEQRGLARGGQAHVEASLILGTEEGTNSTSNSTPEEQEDRIERFAKEKGIWIDDVTNTLDKQ